MSDQIELLTDEELKQILIALGRGQSEFTSNDAMKVFAWAEGVIIEENLLKLVLKGKINISIDESGELIFAWCQK